jgi:hypothetical protein
MSASIFPPAAVLSRVSVAGVRQKNSGCKGRTKERRRSHTGMGARRPVATGGSSVARAVAYRQRATAPSGSVNGSTRHGVAGAASLASNQLSKMLYQSGPFAACPHHHNRCDVIRWPLARIWRDVRARVLRGKSEEIIGKCARAREGARRTVSGVHKRARAGNPT